MKNQVNKIKIIKIGGRVMDDTQQLEQFFGALSKQNVPFILVHGGGDKVNKLVEKFHITPQFVDGRRITDNKSLEAVVMMLAGWINKDIVASLQAKGLNAWGLTGVDANLVMCDKRCMQKYDFGFVGDVKSVNVSPLLMLLEHGITPVLSPITHDGKGQLLNTNADTFAASIAINLAIIQGIEIELYYCLDLQGVYENLDQPDSLIAVLDEDKFKDCHAQGMIKEGMIPKLQNCFSALERGVSKIYVSNATQIIQLLTGLKFKGTAIVKKEKSIHV